jgi:RHS repeat-associated protein
VKKHGRTAGAVGALSLKGTPLAVAGVQPLVGGEGLTAERTAALSTPESVDQRTASATAYEGLSPSEALSLANNTFPAVASEAGAGLPSLPEGEVVSEFIGSNAAQVSEPDGGSGVVEASGEIAVQTSPGQWGGINMSLEEANGTFVPKRAGATARIPKNLSEGVSLPISGLSLTPLASSAGTVASASAGVSDGYAVFWGGSSVGTDVDEIAKLGGGGSFELDSVLRSQRSPEVLRFKLGMPEGAELEQPGGGTGPVFVREAGKTIASVLPPSAVDAQGTQVTGVAMSLSGDILTITVPHPADAYAYPISVDPYVTDELLAGSNTNWRETKDGSKFTISGLSGSGSVTIAGSGSYTLSEAGMIYYPVHPGSEARITTVSVEVSTTLEGHNAEASIQLENNTKKVEKEERFTSNISKSNIGVKGECWKTINPECPYQSEEGTPENVARYALRPTGTGEGASTTVLRASVNLEQENGPELSFDKVSPTVDGGLTNILYSGGWLGPRSGSAFEIHAKDPGLGISYFGISGGGWVEKFPIYEDGECQGVQCNPEFNKGFTYSAKMANGEDALEAIAYDAANKDYAQVWPQYIKVDGAAPHSIVLSGLGPGGQVGAGEYHLKAEATDGTEPALSSGMRSLKLLIDGHTIGISSAPCSPGPCTGHSSTWTIFGHSYATGRHIVTVEAEDNVGNTSSENFTMIVHPASPIALGPGSFNPQSGEYSMTATDVSMGGGLTVSRSYSSEHPTAGAGGPLGTQWGMSLGGQESLVKQPTGSMVLTDASGAQTIFAPNGTGGYISPAGDSNLTLSSAPCEVGQTEFTLKNTAAGTTTCFKVPAGGSGEIWSPHITQGQVATDTVTYSYETAEVPSGSKNMITRPTEALAPVPAGISCSPTLKAGCRALTFNYATSTTAKGEAPTEWGDVEGNLTRVYYTAWEPISKEMKKVEVAHYEYDKMGRLRTVWDPRVKPQPLKPYFGYDSEGHLTALTPPGQETWGIVYGTISGSGVPGAVLKVEQAPPSATVWSGEGLANTEAPKLTGARTTGVRMAVTEGKWSGSPVIYGYQWEDCNTGGGGCVPIAGATNANYIPTSKDAGDRLGVVVTATNGSGSVSVTVYEPASAPTYASSFGAYGTGNGQLREPEGGLATDASGNVWVSDTENNRLEEFNSKGEFVRTVGTRGEGAGQFKTTYGLAVDSKGNIWATDEGNNRVEEFSSEGVFIKMFGWGVSNGEAKLEVCTSSCRAGLQGAGNGEFSIPEGIAIDSKGDVFVADRGNHRVQEFNPELVWVHNLVQGTEKEGPFYLTVDSSNNVWVTYSWDNKIGEFNSEGKLIRTWGTAGTEPGKLSIPYGIAVGPENDVWIAEYRNNRVQVFTQTGEYLYEFGSKGNGPGQFNDAPQGIAFNGSSVYVLDSGVEWENTGNSRVEKWTMPTASKTAVNNMQTIYYTTAANGKYPKCGEHPEWANMACQTQPAEQPTTSGLPGLAVTTYTYNMYGEPTQVKSEVTRSGGGTDTRTTTTTYDEAGRPETTETASTVGTALPKVTDKYNSSTGMLVEQSTSSESLKSEYNTLGQLTSYTDADGNQSIYEYEKEKDYRLKKANDGKGSQTYEYDETTGNVKELKDTEGTSTLTFMAAYDVEGNMTSETYPNAMSANYAHNAAGETTGVEYVKTAHCAKTCPEVWYSDVADPSIHGQWITQQSNQAAQTYTYDEAGRLTQVLDNVAGKGCITRMYAYEEEGNRLSLTTRAPGTGGACATEGGEAQTHTYDPANRLLDTGTEYDSFGDTTKLPAADAGGTALTSTYYEDNELASQTQGTQTIGDQLDPAGRTREIVSTGKTAATEIQHYASPESRTPVWTGELSGSYTRYITGIGGGLVAIRHNNEKAALQLSNLHGDIVATAHDEEAPTTLESAITEASEYGVPASEGPPKYTWLGSQKIPTTLPSGIMAMGARSYVPQLGRYLQTDPKPGGSENQYAYVYGDPVNTTDLSGEWTFEAAAWVVEANAGWGAREEQAQLAREQAAREEAERLAAEAAALAAAQAAMPAESPQPKWVEEYAMGGPSLEETLASEGVVAGGGIEREGIRSLINVIADAGGCPNTNDPCYPKGGKGGSPNEGGTGSGCRSGRSSHDKCVTGNEGGGSIKNVACGLAGAGASGAGPAAGVAAGWLCSELTPR